MQVGATATILRQLPGAGGRQCAIVRVSRMAVQDLSCTDLRIAGSLQSTSVVLCAVSQCILTHCIGLCKLHGGM